MRELRVPFAHTCSESARNGVEIVRFVSPKGLVTWWKMKEGHYRSPVMASGRRPYEYYCPYCGVRLDIELMRHTVAERIRSVKLSDLSRWSFVDIMRRCMYGDGERGDEYLCYDLMADLCTLLDPDGDPEPEECARLREESDAQAVECADKVNEMRGAGDE